MRAVRVWSWTLIVVCVVGGCGSDDGETTMSPGVRMRGVVEGFYGPLYTFEQRRDLLHFLASAGLNAYMYAPKLDPYHREQWRDPYPDEYREHFRELAAAGNQIGVRFIYALSPGQGFDPEAGDVDRVLTKLQSLFDVGVRDFCILFDDVQPDEPGADADVQVNLVAAVRSFLQQLDPQSSLSFIGNFYAGTAEQFAEDRSPFAALYRDPSSAVFEAYARLASEVPILWTGPAVFSHQLTLADAMAIQSYVGRPLWVWDNYPVNDAIVANELFLGPYEGRDPAIGDAVDAMLLNPMLQPELGKIALWTAGRFFAAGEGYDPEAAWEEALSVVTGGEGTAALRAFARFFQSHPFIGDQTEAPELQAAMEEFWANRSPASAERLRQMFTTIAAIRGELEGQLTNQALLAELQLPATKLQMLAEAGLVALDLLSSAGSSGGAGSDALQQRLAAAAQIPWLVGANTRIPSVLANLIGSREAKQVDVFGNFFARVLTEIDA